MRFASGAYQATKGYLKLGANMAEGNFNNNRPNKYSNDVIIIIISTILF